MLDIEGYVARQQSWSRETFGPGDRTKGIIDHIKKELKEIKAKPDDLEEWIDVIILALDGCWRKGYTPYEVGQMLQMKQQKNMSRQWPDWRTAPKNKAVCHIKETP